MMVRSAGAALTIQGMDLMAFRTAPHPSRSTAAVVCASNPSTWFQCSWIRCPSRCCFSIFSEKPASAFSCWAFRRSKRSTSVDCPLPGPACSNRSSSRRCSACASWVPFQASMASQSEGKLTISPSAWAGKGMGVASTARSANHACCSPVVAPSKVARQVESSSSLRLRTRWPASLPSRSDNNRWSAP